MGPGVRLALACAAAVAVVADAALEDVPSFAVPSFEYYSLHDGDAPEQMLQALERGGIIALKNVPYYANVRERFLASAVQCAVASEHDDKGMRYLSTKQFHDSTRRLTLRAAAGRELMDTNADMLERAVDTSASALDKTEFTMGDGERHISARKLIGDAKRFDHFHAYEAASAPPSSTRQSLLTEEIERDLSLAMYEDHGLFIAMAAPKFFSVNAPDGSICDRRLKSDASGPIIGAGELDGIVRPELKPDELVIMMGTGASRWLETSHHLPAVMHGMRMPEEMVWDDEANPGQRNLRAWFGKMTLLPAPEVDLCGNATDTNATLTTMTEPPSSTETPLPTTATDPPMSMEPPLSILPTETPSTTAPPTTTPDPPTPLPTDPEVLAITPQPVTTSSALKTTTSPPTAIEIPDTIRSPLATTPGSTGTLAPSTTMPPSVPEMPETAETTTKEPVAPGGHC
ncbi:hypothetical protein ON010_g684 [Phytophthora cinnamomi]|nr:hypothetical protein ON010_g684 [Phytophthora cinnamomi]